MSDAALTKARGAATYADIEALPPNMVGEIIFDELVAHPRPVLGHGGASSVLGMILGGAFQLGNGGPGGWVFVDEPELHLGPHVVVPDIAGWRVENVPAGLATKVSSHVAPNWVLEVLSPSTEKYDRGDKREIYATYGVDYLWLLDPRTKLLEVFKRQDRDWLVISHVEKENQVSARPFDAITFDMTLLWPFEAPPTEPVAPSG